METQVLEAVRDLLAGRRVLGLAVLIDGEPEAGLLPYAVRADYGAVFVQASGLARHTRGLSPGARVGVLIHGEDAPDADPLQIPRLTVQATVALLERDSEAFERARRIYAGRFPGAEVTLSLGDFNLYELAFGRGRYVAGFGRAYNLGPDSFAQVAGLPSH